MGYYLLIEESEMKFKEYLSEGLFKKFSYEDYEVTALSPKEIIIT